MRLKEIIREITFFDKILFLTLVTLSLSGMLVVSDVVPRGSEIVIENNNRPVYRLPLSENKSVVVEGVTIEIHDGKVRVKESDCPFKLCVKQGWVDRGSIICLPNRVVITVEDSKKQHNHVDAITG